MTKNLSGLDSLVMTGAARVNWNGNGVNDVKVELYKGIDTYCIIFPSDKTSQDFLHIYHEDKEFLVNFFDYEYFKTTWDNAS